jgi:threonine/homoserine/homoserine lactone efflux protein
LRRRADVHALAICLIAFAVGFIGSMPLAGPIAVMVVSRAARGQYRDAYRIGLGAAIAEGAYAAIAFWGFATFLSHHPFVVPLSRGVTAVVLIALGVRFVLWKPKDKKDARENKTGSALAGFSVSALNPTLLVTWSTAVAFLYSKGMPETSGFYALPFGACAGAGVAIWFLVVVRTLRKYEGRLPSLLLTAIVRSLGVVLVGLGVWSGVQLVTWVWRDRDIRTADAASPGVIPALHAPVRGQAVRQRRIRRTSPER